MSDIVWAINPRKDYLRDLAQRMRRFASDALNARNIEFRFDAPDAEQDIRVTTDTRREIYMIFKEAINNIARHSEAEMAQAAFRIERGMMHLEISDDGKGFDPKRADHGQGLTSMRLRAKKLRGEITVISSPGAGTSVTLRAPLR
jgi:signal transduction histidine kinase